MSKVSGGTYKRQGHKENVRLNKPEHSGGEKAVFVHSGLAWCIFHDHKKMIPDGKFTALNALDHPGIMRPVDIILDKNDRKTGFTTIYLKDCVTLAETFTKAFKQRHGYDQDNVLENIRRFREMVAFVHSKDVLIVDLNELNFLMPGATLDQIFAIDVNSYQTASYPATAIMDSIRDRHCNDPSGRPQFSKLTDWFSWGVLTFQMFHGIHPYKGNHPRYSGLELSARMDQRMKDNCSVHDSEAKMPAVVYPLDTAPSGLRDWWKAVFLDGKRIEPPVDFTGAIVIAPVIKQVVGSNLFVIEEIENYGADIIDVRISGPQRVVVTTNNIFVGPRKHSLPGTNVRVGFTPKMNTPISVHVENNQLKLNNIKTNVGVPITAAASAAFVTDDHRIIYKNGGVMMEVVFNEHNDLVMAGSKQVAQVSPSSQVFDGVVLQNLLGRFHASFFPKSGVHKIVAIPELDDYKVVDAKAQGKVLVVVGVKSNGQYDRFTFLLSTAMDQYGVRVTEDITPIGINMVVNDAGVCVLVNEDEQVEAFQANRHAPNVKVFDRDPAVDAGTKLYTDGATILFARGSKLHSFRMKR